jgi:outer membrane protein assembly factor BamE (lipoprotein component of BamABCDE complex)
MPQTRTRRLASAVAATLALAVASGASAEAAKRYTSYNLWYEHPLKLASTGYSKGTLLPAGTEVADLKVSAKALEFKLASGQKLKMIFTAKHHPGFSAESFSQRLFTSKDFAALTAGMSAAEIEAIKAGQLREGMSREAVLVARGYPPESKTRTLDGDEWSYQASRWGSETVRFKDGKLTLEAPPPPPEPVKVEAPKEPLRYLQHNLWFENPEKVYSANYQTGALLPAGTGLRAVVVTGDSIEFTVAATNIDFEIEFNPKHHPGLPIEKFAERLVGDAELAQLTQGFSPEEVKAVQVGEVRPGMSRAAVLVALGHPPESKTTSLHADAWTYFKSRYNSYVVTFKNDKVSLEAAPPAPEPAKVEPAKPEPAPEPPKYLQHNFWFENPDKVPSVNFQTGTLLPVGTAIRGVEVGSDSIEFTVIETGVEYTIEFNPKHHPGLPIAKYAERVIGDKDFKAITKPLNRKELQAIGAGEIRPGMRRAAVLVAAGYPPESKTSTLKASSWVYMRSRYVSYAVQFEGDKVTGIKK